MLRLIDEASFLRVDRFIENVDGSIKWIYQNQLGLDITDGLKIPTENGEVDVWALFTSLRDSGAITVEPAPQSEIQALSIETAKQNERATKLNAFEYKGVMCSVCESDQNGWESLSSRINRELNRGTQWRPIPFFMENGNYVVLDTFDEWESFVDAGWAAREAIMQARLAS